MSVTGGGRRSTDTLLVPHPAGSTHRTCSPRRRRHPLIERSNPVWIRLDAHPEERRSRFRTTSARSSTSGGHSRGHTSLAARHSAAAAVLPPAGRAGPLDAEPDHRQAEATNMRGRSSIPAAEITAPDVPPARHRGQRGGRSLGPEGLSRLRAQPCRILRQSVDEKIAEPATGNS